VPVWSNASTSWPQCSPDNLQILGARVPRKYSARETESAVHSMPKNPSTERFVEDLKRTVRPYNK
jgi:hypothetical protein